MAVNVYKAVLEPYTGETHYLLAKSSQEAVQKIDAWMDKKNKERTPDAGEELWFGIDTLEKLCEIDIE